MAALTAQRLHPVADAERRDGRQRQTRDHATIRARRERAASCRGGAERAGHLCEARGVEAVAARERHLAAVEGFEADAALLGTAGHVLNRARRSILV